MKHLDTVKFILGDTLGVASGQLGAASLLLGSGTTFAQEMLLP